MLNTVAATLIVLFCATMTACAGRPTVPDAGTLDEDPGYSEDPRPVDYDAAVGPPPDGWLALLARDLGAKVMP